MSPGWVPGSFQWALRRVPVKSLLGLDGVLGRSDRVPVKSQAGPWQVLGEFWAGPRQVPTGSPVSLG